MRASTNCFKSNQCWDEEDLSVNWDCMFQVVPLLLESKQTFILWTCFRGPLTSQLSVSCEQPCEHSSSSLSWPSSSPSPPRFHCSTNSTMTVSCQSPVVSVAPTLLHWKSPWRQSRTGPDTKVPGNVSPVMPTWRLVILMRLGTDTPFTGSLRGREGPKAPWRCGRWIWTGRRLRRTGQGAVHSSAPKCRGRRASWVVRTRSWGIWSSLSWCWFVV